MKCGFLASCLVAVVAVRDSYATSVSFTFKQRPVSANEASNGAPVDGTVFQYFVTTDSDILTNFALSIRLDAPLYNNMAVGSDVEPPDPAIVTLFPSVGADSWITTPGVTSLAGASFLGVRFDATNDGPQTNFHFAQLTTTGRGDFSGEIHVVNGPGVAVFPFSFSVLAGDYNANGSVDAADYVVWRNTNMNGAQGYNVWRASFGEPAGRGSFADHAVPEPATWVLAIGTAHWRPIRRRY